MGFDDDVEEGIVSAIMSCIGQIEELTTELDLDDPDHPDYWSRSRHL